MPHRGSGEPRGSGVKGIDVTDEAAEFGRLFQWAKEVKWLSEYVSVYEDNGSGYCLRKELQRWKVRKNPEGVGLDLEVWTQGSLT